MKTPSKREILVLTGHLCPKCDEFTELVESSEIYGTDFGLLYRCPTCHAYVGCHKGSLNAKGSVAGRNLRELRKSAHRLFDEAQCRRTIELCKAYAKEEGIRRI